MIRKILCIAMSMTFGIQGTNFEINAHGNEGKINNKFEINMFPDVPSSATNPGKSYDIPTTQPQVIVAEPPYSCTLNADLSAIPGTEVFLIKIAAAGFSEILDPATNSGPSYRTIINAQTDTPLNVTLTSLNGATYTFVGFSGTQTGGSFSSNNTTGTLSNALVTQDVTNAATGTLSYQVGNISGASSFANIGLTGSTITNATITGTTTGDYFTGTDFIAGTISLGNFGIIFIEFPAGTEFNIVAGELGTTGKFTSTAVGYAYTTGTLSSPGVISNANATLIGTVDGTFNYLGTNFTNGSLSNKSFTGFFGTGTSSDVNHFTIVVPGTGTIANSSSITISRNLSTNSTGTIYITNGGYAGELLTGLSGVQGALSAGTSNASLTGYNGATIAITSPCIQGNTSTGTIHLVDTLVPVTILNANISGTIQAQANGLSYIGTQIVTGSIVLTIGDDFEDGPCV